MADGRMNRIERQIIKVIPEFFAERTWARLTWGKRMTQWLRGDERRGFRFMPAGYWRRYGGKLTMQLPDGTPLYEGATLRKRRLEGIEYTIPLGQTIFAETLSQWNLTSPALSKAIPQ